MDLGNAEHERRMGKKDKEVQELKQKYSELENQYNELKFDYDYGGEQFDKRVNRVANTRLMMITNEKDQEIQRLQEQINQLLTQQGSQVTEMEEEVPKTKPERIEIEEKKEEVIPRHGMQTRSQGPPSFGEQIQQEDMIQLEILYQKEPAI